MSGLASGKKAADKQKGSGVVFAFEKSEHMVLECAGKLRVKIMASRAPGVTVQLRYYTQEGTAKSGVRYSDVDGSLRFTANQTERYIDIPIIDNDTWEPDEHFFIHIADLQVLQGHFSTHGAESTEYQIGLDATRVTVVNDDMPGTLDFDFLEVFSKNGEDAILGINRTHGTCGPITCKYTTKDDAAVKGIDYTHVEAPSILQMGRRTRASLYRLSHRQRRGLRMIASKLYSLIQVLVFSSTKTPMVARSLQFVKWC